MRGTRKKANTMVLGLGCSKADNRPSKDMESKNQLCVCGRRGDREGWGPNPPPAGSHLQIPMEDQGKRPPFTTTQ